MSATFTDRVANIAPEGAYRVMAKANDLEAQGRNILHLEIGQPDFPTFPPICEAGKQAIDDGFTRYNPSAGYGDLRELIAQQRSENDFPTNPSEVVIGPGAKPGLIFPLLALIDKGDEVLYPDPGFPTYRSAIELASGTPIPVPLLESNSFSFDLEALEKLISPKTKLLILNSPANPTGGVIPQSDIDRIAALALEYGFWVLSDEIYSRLVYDLKNSPSIASRQELKDRLIIVDGFSKTYAMTGWRLGYAIMPDTLARKVELLLMHTIGCTAGFTQKAGVAALETGEPYLSDVVQRYRTRRNRFIDGLNQIDGITCQLPEGAFYAFPNVSQLGLSSDELANRLLQEAGIACLSGTDFGPRGEGYLRFSYATSQTVLDECKQKLSDFVKAL